jgi:hypothetical protein
MHSGLTQAESWKPLRQYSAGVSNSDNGDDGSCDDCNSGDCGDNDNGGGGNNMPKRASARPRRTAKLAHGTAHQQSLHGISFLVRPRQVGSDAMLQSYARCIGFTLARIKERSRPEPQHRESRAQH